MCVVQMILFKELRSLLAAKNPGRPRQEVSLLSGAITNELFGAINDEETFLNFRRQNRAEIEQEMLSLARTLPTLNAPLTDALRVLALCDNMEGKNSERLLTQAAELGILIHDRDIPLPSTFITMVRHLGDSHHLISSPQENTSCGTENPVQ